MIKNKATKTIILSFCILIITGVFTVGNSNSYYSDTATMKGNVISSGNWTNKNSNQKVSNGDVIINEIHWASSPASDNDQWIELFNTTEEDIHLKGWIIENASITPKDFKITGNPTIEAHEYLLITKRKDNSNQSALAVPTDVENASLYLNRDKEGYKQLTLKDADSNIIDRTPEKNSPWPEGVYEDGEKYFSMQRKDNTQEKGADEGSWYTCNPNDFIDVEELNTMKSYWNNDYHENVCGTPRNENLPSDTIAEDKNTMPTPLSIPTETLGKPNLEKAPKNTEEDEESKDESTKNKTDDSQRDKEEVNVKASGESDDADDKKINNGNQNGENETDDDSEKNEVADDDSTSQDEEQSDENAPEEEDEEEFTEKDEDETVEDQEEQSTGTEEGSEKENEGLNESTEINDDDDVSSTDDTQLDTDTKSPDEVEEEPEEQSPKQEN